MSRPEAWRPLNVSEAMAFMEGLHEQYQASLREAAVPGGMFNHLRKVDSTSATARNIPRMLGDAVVSAAMTNAVQYAFVIGPVGIGKTETLIRMSLCLDRLLEAPGMAELCWQQTLVTAEDALWAGHMLKRGGKYMVDPGHYQAFHFIKEDYSASSEIFGQALLLAGEEDQFVLGEPPCSAGYEFTTPTGETEMVGNDRCTSAVRALSRRQGIFEGFNSNLIIAALTADTDQYKANLESRAQDQKDRVDNARRPGGTLSGTARANQELTECIRAYYLTGRRRDLFESDRVEEFIGINWVWLLAWSADVVPWLLKEYFAVQPEYAGIFENYQPTDKLDPKILAERSFIHALHKRSLVEGKEIFEALAPGSTYAHKSTP